MCQLMIRQVSPPSVKVQSALGLLGLVCHALIGLYLLKLMHLSYKTKQTAKALPG